MKTVYLFLTVLVMLSLSACQSELDSFKDEVIEDPTTTYVEGVIGSINGDYDKDLLLSELKSKVFVLSEQYALARGKWIDMQPYEDGIAFEDDCCYTYQYHGMPGSHDITLKCEKYEYTILDSESSVVLQFKSNRGAFYDLVAKVIDFTDGVVVFEGLLPLSDNPGDLSAWHRLYIGKLDANRRAEWDEVLASQE